MKRNSINRIYTQWLQGLISNDERSGRRYAKLLKTLAATEFSYFVPNDDNRSEDGKKLRTVFLNALRKKSYVRRSLSDLDLSQEPCSFLEMLVALAIRFDEAVISGTSERCVDCYFWEFIQNLGLGMYTDEGFNENRVERIIEICLARTYAYTGKGGIFPLRHPKKDQRKVELWYQMMAYLDENYDI